MSTRPKVIADIKNVIESLHDAGTYKNAPVIDGPMGATVKLSDGREVVNLCSNNYLGLANHQKVLAGLETLSISMASAQPLLGSFVDRLQFMSNLKMRSRSSSVSKLRLLTFPAGTRTKPLSPHCWVRGMW